MLQWRGCQENCATQNYSSKICGWSSKDVYWITRDAKRRAINVRKTDSPSLTWISRRGRMRVAGRSEERSHREILPAAVFPIPLWSACLRQLRSGVAWFGVEVDENEKQIVNPKERLQQGHRVPGGLWFITIKNRCKSEEASSVKKLLHSIESVTVRGGGWEGVTS